MKLIYEPADPTKPDLSRFQFPGYEKGNAAAIRAHFEFISEVEAWCYEQFGKSKLGRRTPWRISGPSSRPWLIVGVPVNAFAVRMRWC